MEMELSGEVISNFRLFVGPDVFRLADEFTTHLVIEVIRIRLNKSELITDDITFIFDVS